MKNNDIHSLSHTKWNCKYHIVFAPKYRRKVFYGLELSSQMQRYIKINFKRRFPVQAFAWTLI